MALQDIRLKLEVLAQKICEAHGLDLIELKVNGHKNDVLIQVVADKPFGGITMNECAILNRYLVTAIEQENVLPPEVFSLELSSPGLDRPLVTRKDFMRVVGQEVDFWLVAPVQGKKELQGRLAQVTENELMVDTPAGRLAVSLSSVIKGKLVI